MEANLETRFSSPRFNAVESCWNFCHLRGKTQIDESMLWFEDIFRHVNIV